MTGGNARALRALIVGLLWASAAAPAAGTVAAAITTPAFAQFLAEKGEGVHHIAVAATNYDELLAAEAERGNELVLSCELSDKFNGIKVAYLGTQRALGVTLEVFNGLPGGRRKPSAA